MDMMTHVLATKIKLAFGWIVTAVVVVMVVRLREFAYILCDILLKNTQ